MDNQMDNRRGLTIFTCMWALFIVFHYCKAEAVTTAITTPIQFIVLLTACTVALHPWRTAGLALLACLQVVEFLTMTPKVSNHWTFNTALSITLLGALILAQVKDGKIDRAALFATFAPITRICVLILYFFVTFHKLNADFFDPVVSCSAFLYQRLAETLPLPTSTPFLHLSIYATLLAEAGIPILIAVPRTRWLGIGVGVAFHGLLAFDHFYDFSSLLFTLFLLFATPGTYTALFERHERLLKLVANRRDVRMVLLIALYGFSGAMAFRTGLDLGLSNAGLVIAWGIYLAALLILWIPVSLPRVNVPQPGLRQMLHTPRLILLIAPLLLVVNGVSPYLGLRTGTSFDMWSNLQAFAPDNHLIMPPSLNLLSTMTIPYTVVDSDSQLLNFYRDNKLYITRWELQRQIYDQPDLAVIYAEGRDGDATPVTAENREEFLRGYSPLLAKIITFKPISVDGRGICP